MPETKVSSDPRNIVPQNKNLPEPAGVEIRLAPFTSSLQPAGLRVEGWLLKPLEDFGVRMASEIFSSLNRNIFPGMQMPKSFASSGRYWLAVSMLFLAHVCRGDPLDDWFPSNSGVQANLNSVIYANGQFVAVGDNGTILTSPDGIVWSNCASGTQQSLTGVAYGNGGFIAVGNQILLTSIDAFIWTNQNTNPYAIEGVCYGNQQFVAFVNDGTQRWYWTGVSPDGTTWTWNRSISSRTLMFGIAFANNGLVAVGGDCCCACFGDGCECVRDAYIYYSTNGLDWSIGRAPEPRTYGYNFLRGVDSDRGTLVVVGNAGTILNGGAGSNEWTYSWTSQPSSTTNDLFAVSHGGNEFIAVGSGGAILTSPDSSSWISRNSATTNTLRSVAYNGIGFVVVGDTGTIICSGDIQPQAPTIITPPASQFIQAGATATISVAASGQQPISYQWRFNGNPIIGATKANMVLNSINAGNSGGYSVNVSNPYGSVASSTAYLAVLADGANGNTPVEIIGSPAPAKLSGKDNLVIVTHGCVPGPEVQPAPQWVSDMSSAIQAHAPSDWQVSPYLWPIEAWAWAPTAADPNLVTLWDIEAKVMPNAKKLGTQLGAAIATESWEHVHFIGHSAGAALIQCAADALRHLSPSTEIHATFLDPYLDLDYSGRNWYGQNADWADCYYAIDLQTRNFTDGPLANTYNVDVTGVDPNKSPIAIACSSSTAESTVLDNFCGQETISTHEWPHEFYQASVSAGLQSCANGYGFPMSKEGGGWNERGLLTRGNTPWAPCGQLSTELDPFPITLRQSVGIDLLPAAGSLAGVSLSGNSAFTLTSDDPAWFAMGVTVTNPANTVEFNAVFMDTNAAHGLLTVYWNTNQIGLIDELVAPSGLRTDHFLLPATMTEGVFTLSFRLDTFSNTTSIVTVTNLSLGFVGPSQPIMLDMALNTNAMPIVQLTAAPGYKYLLQSSTNLRDWTSLALLPNTNGTVYFADPTLTNVDRRFYRATVR